MVHPNAEFACSAYIAMYQEDINTEDSTGSFSQELAPGKLEALSLTHENDEFFDALCSPCSDISLKSCSSDIGKPSCTQSQSSDSYGTFGSECGKYNTENDSSFHCETNADTKNQANFPHTNQAECKKERRTTVPPKAEHGFSLWSLVKHCIGKDLTKIPLPVYFNEPLSTLQRLTEEYEYAELLNHAATLDDSCEQLIYVAAFVISSYSSSSKRTGKPFNPLLGETFECDRLDDLGWRCISEQVSHHPPVLAQHCEGKTWTAWQEFSMTTKLKGTSLLVNPVGINHLKFTNTGYHYTWNKVSTTVHNLVLGTLWLDHSGEIKIKNHVTGDECIVQFVPYKCFSADSYRKVTGYAKDGNNATRWILQGTWDSKIEAAQCVRKDEELKSENFQPIWKRKPPSIEDDKYYNMTLLASQLNEPEDDVAPTDSRLRPDQRLMEEGKWEEANQVKVELEEKQRRKRQIPQETAEDEGYDNCGYTPAWFKRVTDELTDLPIHIYTGEYWSCKDKGDWSRCPDIFL